ncbi:hypothetical protein ACLB2K_032422 [Fragaria x ananassa]
MSTSNDTNSSAVHDPAAVRENKKKITVRTSDGEDFELEENVAMELGTIKTFLEEPGVSQDTVLFPFPRVQSWQMMMVIKYCTKFLKLKAKLDGDVRGTENLPGRVHQRPQQREHIATLYR